jgi:hypothetical protein
VLAVKVLAASFIMALLFSVLVGTMYFGTVQASTEVNGITKPSVPEFTLVLVDSSYDVPTTYSIDPYTGKNVTHYGYHVEDKKIGMKIKNNQPFNSYYDDKLGQTIGFYYNIRFKGSFSEEWTELYRASDGYPHQWSDSDYTVITFLSETGKTIESYGFSRTFPDGAKVDYQVEAMIGYVHRDASIPFAPWVFTGEKSGWSETLTLTVPISTQFPTITLSPTTTPEPTPPISPTPTPNENSRTLQSEAIVGAFIAVAVIVAGLGLLIYLIKRR